MKTRFGFVSNSSSTSFTCDICGKYEAGWDLCLRDTDMVQCENGHTICRKHTINNYYEIRSAIYKADLSSRREEIYHILENYGYKEENYIDKEDEEIVDLLEDFIYGYDIPKKYCPICNFEFIISKDINKYIKAKNNMTEDDYRKEIKVKFNNYEELKNFIKGIQEEHEN